MKPSSDTVSNKGPYRVPTRLGTIRVRAGLSQKDAARRLGLNKAGHATISGWEQGWELPSDEMIEAMAKLYKASLADFRYACGLTFAQGHANTRNRARLIKPLGWSERHKEK